MPYIHNNIKGKQSKKNGVSLSCNVVECYFSPFLQKRSNKKCCKMCHSIRGQKFK